METTMNAANSLAIETLRIGAFAGVAGGFAEVVWIGSYGVATGTPVEPVARGIAASILPTVVESSSAAAWLGLLIHLGLAIALGLCLAFVLRHVSCRAGTTHSELGLVMLTLTAVWAMNFLVALQYINPAFVGLLPYSVTLLSKLLFGLSAATVFRVDRLRRAKIPR
jgi:hypothetical protein